LQLINKFNNDQINISEKKKSNVNYWILKGK
jgi:hypothetical protein